ncbi:hypothetical protein Vretifemale_1888 [Volvox reticuliferus]|nr:hypothetical protein Vretifemale_1888 [Volvox reticuliferus]
MLAHHTTRFIDELPDLVDNYNSTPHSSLKNKTPGAVYKDLDLQRDMYDQLTRQNEALESTIDIGIGDYVRKRVDRGRFDKEDAKFSSEIYVVDDIEGRKYVLIDADGSILPRRYKYFELQLVDPRTVEGKVQATKKQEAENTHRKVRRVGRELGKKYGEAEQEVELAEGREAPKPKPKKAKRGRKPKKEVIDGEEHVEVSRFEGSRFNKVGKLEYQVRFKGDTKLYWIPAKQLAQDLSPDAFSELKKGLKKRG